MCRICRECVDNGCLSYVSISEILAAIYFAMEYIARISLSKSKKEYVTSFYGLIDLVSFVPSLVAFGLVDLRFVRILRLFRVLRLLKFLRYNKAIDRLKGAFKETRDELIVFSFITAVLVYISAVGIYYFEHDVQPEKFTTIAESMWWAIATLTTVGYGDVFPITTGGRLFTTIIVLIGLGFVAVPSGLIAAALSKVK